MEWLSNEVPVLILHEMSLIEIEPSTDDNGGNNNVLFGNNNVETTMCCGVPVVRSLSK